MVERTSRVVETMAACGSANDEPGQGRCLRGSGKVFESLNFPISGTRLTFSGYYDKIDDWYFQLVSEEETSHPSTG
jgi:hypothetical protein